MSKKVNLKEFYKQNIENETLFYTGNAFRGTGKTWALEELKEEGYIVLSKEVLRRGIIEFGAGYKEDKDYWNVLVDEDVDLTTLRGFKIQGKKVRIVGGFTNNSEDELECSFINVGCQYVDLTELTNEYKSEPKIKDKLTKEDFEKSKSEFIDCIKNVKSKNNDLEDLKRFVDTSKLMSEVLKDLKDAWTEFENSMNSKKSNKIEELQKNLDIINSKSDNFYYYIKNNELFELDKKTENVGCWCSLSKVMKSYFLVDEDDEGITDKLVLEFKDRDDDIIICPVQGAYC